MTYVVEYIVQYTDPDRPVDGPVKTRHFPSRGAAESFLETLDRLAPKAHSIQFTRQTTTTVREIL